MYQKLKKLSQQLHTTICIVNEAAQLAEQLQRRGINMLSLVDAFESYVVEASDRSKAMQKYWDDVHAGRIDDPRFDPDADDSDAKDDKPVVREPREPREPEKRESSVKRTAKKVANNSKAALQTASTQVKSWASKQSKKRWDDFKKFAHTLFNDDHLTMYSR